MNAAAAHGVHEVTNIQYATDTFFGVKLATWVERMSALSNDLGGKRYVSGDHQVVRYAIASQNTA